MFPNGTVWSLPELAGIPSWRVAWAVADRTAPAPANSSGLRLGLQHLAAGAVDPVTLWRHEALGGKVVDHPVYGPMPIASRGTRKALRAATGLRIPTSALVVHGAGVTRLFATLEQHGLLGVEGDVPPDAFQMLLVWDPFVEAGKSQPAGLVGVTDLDRSDHAGSAPLVTVSDASFQLWQQPTEVAVVSVDGVIDVGGDFGWSVS